MSKIVGVGAVKNASKVSEKNDKEIIKLTKQVEELTETVDTLTKEIADLKKNATSENPGKNKDKE